MGCIILGYATKLRAPKAIVFYGPTAENGKSQVLELFRSLLPESAASSIPIHTLGDERHAPKLAGVMLNASDELSGSKATSSDVFKKFVTGDPVHGREVFMRAFTFKPTALHIFATNTLPVFRGGFDNGLKRRLLVLLFEKPIPSNEQIADIAKLIVREEADLCLDFAMAGAARLLKNGEFTVPKEGYLNCR